MSNFKLPIFRFALSAVFIAIGATLSLTPALAATVSIYKVTDADGRVTYQNVEPQNDTGRIEKKAFDLEANAMNFTRPRAVGSAPGGGTNVNNNDIATRLVDELLRRTGSTGTSMSISRGPGSVVFSDQATTGISGGGEVSGIVTPSGNLIGSDNATLNNTGGGNNNAGGGTGMGGGEGTGPAITNPSTGGATFTGNNQTFTGTNQTFSGNSPTFTSNSATFSSDTGTLGPATPGVGAGTTGGAAATNSGATTSGTSNNSSPATSPQIGITPGTNPFASGGTNGNAITR